MCRVWVSVERCVCGLDGRRTETIRCVCGCESSEQGSDALGRRACVRERILCAREERPGTGVRDQERETCRRVVPLPCEGHLRGFGV